MYFVSCVLLMRMNMPIEYRSVAVFLCATRPDNVSCHFVFCVDQQCRSTVLGHVAWIAVVMIFFIWLTCFYLYKDYDRSSVIAGAQWRSQKFLTGDASICSIPSYPSLLICRTKSALQSKNIMMHEQLHVTGHWPQ